MIETKNASLSTMAVTIQALHVSGKQMTLSVFRQLPSEYFHLVADRQLPIWGHVRYRTDSGELWLVAQHGSALVRVCIDPTIVVRVRLADAVTKAQDAWTFSRQATEPGRLVEWRDRLWSEVELFQNLCVERDRLAYLDRAIESPQLFIAV